MGIIFQNGELLDDLTAEENVSLPLWVQNQEVKKNAVKTLLDELEVPTGRSVSTLSGGEYQRASLARALINNPKIIIADEPTASLDPKLRNEICSLLIEQAREHNATLVVVTHDPYLTERADKKYYLCDGELTALP